MSAYSAVSPYPVMSTVISVGYRFASSSDPNPARAAAPGARFWMNTSARLRMLCSRR